MEMNISPSEAMVMEQLATAVHEGYLDAEERGIQYNVGFYAGMKLVLNNIDKPGQMLRVVSQIQHGV